MTRVNRRNFIKKLTIQTTTALSVPQIVSSALKNETPAKIIFKRNNTILFQGDSITDWWRIHGSKLPNTTNALGAGYVLLTAGQLLYKYADKNLQVYNKGVSGDKVYQLANRWETDCLQYNPDILSIHVGLNDYWHTLTHAYKGTIRTYISDYQKLLERTKRLLPNINLVICEPFAVKGVKVVDDGWFPAFDLFRKAARDVAHQYNAVFVPFQSVFDKAIEAAPPAYWSLDGVHPTVAGEVLMANTWIKAACG